MKIRIRKRIKSKSSTESKTQFATLPPHRNYASNPNVALDLSQAVSAVVGIEVADSRGHCRASASLFDGVKFLAGLAALLRVAESQGDDRRQARILTGTRASNDLVGQK